MKISIQVNIDNENLLNIIVGDHGLIGCLDYDSDCQISIDNHWFHTELEKNRFLNTLENNNFSFTN